MQIVGLCKTFGCNEFINAALESLYPFLDKIVFVHSEISWAGDFGNTVKPVIKGWAKENDVDNKIVHFDCNTKSQNEQYQFGYEYIKNRYNPDWIMMFDTDEVWDEYNLQLAKGYLDSCDEYNAIASNMHTYIKSPFYRVTPPEYCRPTVFVRPIHKILSGIRGNGVLPRVVPANLFFHHFTYVRLNESDVFKKIETTLHGDREDIPMCTLVDMDKWRVDKWDNLPNAKDFHTTKHYEKSWHEIKVIEECDLPKTVLGTEIINKWRAK